MQLGRDTLPSAPSLGQAFGARPHLSSVRRPGTGRVCSDRVALGPNGPELRHDQRLLHLAHGVAR